MNRTALMLALTAGITCVASGYEPQRHNDTFTTNGVTYAQRGGLGAADYVVTQIDDSAIGKVTSVNGMDGDVVIDAKSVGAVAHDANYLAVSNRAMTALQSYTETDPRFREWVGGVTNQYGIIAGAESAMFAYTLGEPASEVAYSAEDITAISNGFYIGEQTLYAILTNKADKAEVDSAIHTVREDNEKTRQIVTTWENFLDGSNVVFSITNYLSGTYSLDAAKMTIKELRDGKYKEVYNSRDEIILHINDFSNRYVKVAIDAIVDEVASRLASKADRDWGKYTSAGGEAPENTVYMTAPNTVFAGGLEYERVAVGEGTICVLTTHGAPVWTQGDEGTFKFQDDGGTNYFGFAKTDSYTIGANTDGITVQSGIVTMNYNITMSGRPCVWYKADLTSNTPWEQLNLPDGSPVAGASHAVTWEQNPTAGTQVCYINVGNQPQGFFRATVEVAGEAKFMTNMPADLSGGIICTNTATGENGVIRPTFNGTTVQWTWSSQ